MRMMNVYLGVERALRNTKIPRIFSSLVQYYFPVVKQRIRSKQRYGCVEKRKSRTISKDPSSEYTHRRMFRAVHEDDHSYTRCLENPGRVLGVFIRECSSSVENAFHNH